MKILVCIDDTDNIGTKGTGFLAENVRTAIRAMGGSTAFISRHQLYVHKDVPYTSHNSSMCFEADIEKGQLQDVIAMTQNMLVHESAEGSDPGLCVAIKDEIPDPASLLRYGRAAKCSLLTKEQAYALAQAEGIHLSEHGGTGGGVIGALAGVALRLSGFDGRVKGNAKTGLAGHVMSAAELRNITGFSTIVGIDGTKVEDSDSVFLAEGAVKAVLLNWQSTIVTVWDKEESLFRVLTKDQAKCY